MSKLECHTLRLGDLTLPELPSLLADWSGHWRQAMEVAPEPSKRLLAVTLEDLVVWHHRGRWYPITHLAQLRLMQPRYPDWELEVIVREAASLDEIRIRQALQLQLSYMQPSAPSGLWALQQQLQADFGLPPLFRQGQLARIFGLERTTFFKQAKTHQRRRQAAAGPGHAPIDAQQLQDAIPDRVRHPS